MTNASRAKGVMPRRQSSRTLALVTAALLADLSLLLSGCVGEENAEPRRGGPLSDSGRYLSFHEPMEPVGAEISEGFMVLGTSEPIIIESVTVEGGDQAFEFLGARIGLPGRPDGFNQWMSGYPPKAVPARYQKPAEGARLEPGSDYMFILGYRVEQHVLDLRTSVTVRYRTEDDEVFERKHPAQVLTCPDELGGDETDVVKNCRTEARSKYGSAVDLGQ